MSERRVVVTGLGLLTGLGLDLETSWTGIVEGARPAGFISNPNDLEQTVAVAVQLPAGADELFKQKIKPRSRAQMTRGTMIALVTASAALEDSGLDLESCDRERIGVVAGATGTGYFHEGADPDSNRILRNMASAGAAWISLKAGLLGPSMVVSTACSSGVYALAGAWNLIANGDCDVVVAGSADSSLNYMDLQGFNALMALAQPTGDPAVLSRPFDRDRTGFVIAEGGGMLVLESAEHAASRGARLYAEMPRPGLVSEGYNILSPKPGGEGMARAMQAALKVASMKADEIDYINAHGTSTPLNDLYETQAIHSVFGHLAAKIPVSSTKSSHGHCLAGAAGVEAVLSVMALDRGVIPATLNLDNLDPELDLDFVPWTPRRQELGAVMCNSFAFGGQNGVCIFRKPRG